MRVGLVLGAGGVIGGSWLMGALEALEAETGWRAADAELVVGTSAGSVIGAMAAAGRPSEYISAYAAGATLDDVADAELRAVALAARAGAGEYRLEWTPPSIGPGSWRLAAATLLQPHRHTPTALLAGWLPRGCISTAPIRDVVEAFIEDPWPRRTRFWAVAADYATGRRIAFGRGHAGGADHDGVRRFLVFGGLALADQLRVRRTVQVLVGAQLLHGFHGDREPVGRVDQFPPLRPDPDDDVGAGHGRALRRGERDRRATQHQPGLLDPGRDEVHRG
jgi:hypothetical protein